MPILAHRGGHGTRSKTMTGAHGQHHEAAEPLRFMD